MFDFDDLPEAFADQHLPTTQLPSLLGRTVPDQNVGKAFVKLPLGDARKLHEQAVSHAGNLDDNASDSFSSTSESEQEIDILRFPEGFTFGSATAAYQIEGAAKEGGRAPSIWDDFSRRTGSTANGATGDVACDHYHRFRDDVALMAKLGLKAYRFSISWSRLIPDGTGVVNKEGAAFYSDLIDALLEQSIEPWVTLYHWDLPSALEEQFGGWLGPKRKIVNAFGKFARTCFRLFGSRVKRWMTLNEPYCVAVMGYASGMHAPGRFMKPATEPYIVGHNLLLAHAEAVHIYRTQFAEEQRGQIGIVLNINFRKPIDSSSDLDGRATQRLLDFELGWFADPIFKGDYPARMRETCGDRLPAFTEAERAMLLGSSDFLGVNYYFSTFVAAPNQAGSPLTRRQSGGLKPGISCWGDAGVRLEKDPGWESTDMGWVVTPWGLREVLLHMHKAYTPPCGLYVTENGCAFEPEKSLQLDAKPGALEPTPYSAANGFREDLDTETFFDGQRDRFLRCHLSAMHSAIEAGADVRGYFVWSLMDNFEWSEGYTKRFGIVRVDYDTQKRTIKESGRTYAEVIKQNGIEKPPPWEQFAASFRRPSIQDYSPKRKQANIARNFGTN